MSSSWPRSPNTPRGTRGLLLVAPSRVGPRASESELLPRTASELTRLGLQAPRGCTSHPNAATTYTDHDHEDTKAPGPGSAGRSRPPPGHLTDSPMDRSHRATAGRNDRALWGGRFTSQTSTISGQIARPFRLRGHGARLEECASPISVLRLKNDVLPRLGHKVRNKAGQ
jgi:hypothetical protein